MDSAAMEGMPGEPACPLCGALDGDALGISANGSLVRCGRCTLTYHPELLCAAAQHVEPLVASPSTSLRVDSVEPYYGGDEEYDAYRRRKEPQWEDLFRRLRRYVRGGRLLDVGCARGYSAVVARRCGFDAYGVEVSAADAAYARENLGLPVRTGTVEQAGFPEGFFDAVVVWVVLEHLSAPADTMAAISRVLRAGGILNIFTPNAASRAAREQGVGWIEYNRPGHAVLFSPATLRRLLREHGLEPVELYTTLWGGGASGGRDRGALMRWAMGPRLAPVRSRIRRMLSVLAGEAAWQGEYMGVYARKSG